MAERLTGKRRIESASIQGEGSYVILRAMTVAEMREVMSKAEGETVSIPIPDLAARIVEWDWVDYDGAPLPFPAAEPGVMDRLTSEEIHWLVVALLSGRSDADTKNSKSD